MFDNIGGKVKILAKGMFILEAIGAVVVGFALIADDVTEIGLPILLLGPLVAWLSSWLLYAFGQLVENSDIIAAEFSRKNEKHEKTVAKNEERKQTQRRKEVKATIANPEIAEEEFVDVVCTNCKAELSFTKGQLQSGEEVICPLCDAKISL